jgi:uncharacterized membrane protein YeaQ/YmgE (transglycosylase-associated protein family)
MLAVLSWLLVGFFVGWLARLVTGGGGPRGFFLTSLFGIAGGVAGGVLARQFHLPTSGAGGLLMSVIGAVILVFAFAFIAGLTRGGRRRG